MNEFLLIAIFLLSALTLLVFLLSFRKTEAGQITRLEGKLDHLAGSLEKLERVMREEGSANREISLKTSREQRTEIAGLLKNLSDTGASQMMRIANMQKSHLEAFAAQLKSLTEMNEQKLEKMRETVESRLRNLQEDNSKKIDEMRAVVDEKLQSTLEKRLSDSFRLVSERLDTVHKSLGEMQTLAAGVGDLKKVLTNVKTRGTWGEIALGSLLEQILTKEQYDKNVATKKDSTERVEYAIRLPGRGQERGIVYIPIDAKFPKEDYERLVEAQDRADLEGVEKAARALEARIKNSAKDIQTKYIDPPNTTDFAIMFLPTEGLYAEILRRTDLTEVLQREYRIVLAGPTTLAAILNSLQMGFRTLAVEKRSSEVWELLGTVKTEFGKFTRILDATHKKIREAGNSIEDAVSKTRTIELKIHRVQEMPVPEETSLFPGGQ